MIGVARNFFRGDSTNSFEDRGQRERGLGAVAPQSGVPLYLQVSETRILIRLLRMIFHGTGNLTQPCQNFGVSGVAGLNPPNPPPPRYATDGNKGL
jgi:hypothetical protein